MRGALLPWAVVAALITAQSAVGVWADSEVLGVVELMEEAESNPHLAGLHHRNHGLLKQIDDIQNDRAPTPIGAMPEIGPAGPSPMAGMMAVGAPTGEARMAGIKEALTAVKPIMDKYVNTAKTLTGKYSHLKKAYNKIKEAANNDPQLKARMDEAMKSMQSEDAKKYKALNKKYSDLVQADTKEKQEAASKELSLEEKVQKLRTTNQAVAKSFFAELDQARSAAKSEVRTMRVELDRFMRDSAKDKFDELGEATSKALEENRVLALKAPMMKSAVKKLLEEEDAKDARKEQEEWGNADDKDKDDDEDDDGYGDDAKKLGDDDESGDGGGADAKHRADADDAY